MSLSLLSSPEAPAISLRPYQVQAVEAVYDHLRRRDDNPCVAIPTAGGNPHLPHDVQLDVRLIEAEQVTTPNYAASSAMPGPAQRALTPQNQVDGILFDAYGNPRTYHVLREHPGNGSALGVCYDAVPAAGRVVRKVHRTDGYRSPLQRQPSPP